MISQTDASTHALPDNTIHLISAQSIDKDRVRVKVELAENHSRPNLILTLTDSDNIEVSRSMIMGSIDFLIEFTLHIRVQNPKPPFTLTCITCVQEEEPIDTKSSIVNM